MLLALSFKKKKINGENGHICIIQSPFISEITLHSSWIIQIASLTSLSSILVTSNRNSLYIGCKNCIVFDNLHLHFTRNQEAAAASCI